MREKLTPHSIANNIRMTRSQYKGTFLVLEGDTDARLFKRFVKKDLCKIIPAHGKCKALMVLETLNKESFSGLLVVVDADFWGAEGFESETKNLLVTDTHDMETLILKSSDCLERLLDEYGKQKILDASKGSVLDVLFDCARPVGYLRWICQQDGRGRIRFRDLNFELFVAGHPLRPYLDRMFVTIMEQCVAKEARDGIDLDSLKSELKTLMKEDHDLWQICNGHDMMKVLAVGLRNVFGNRKAKTLDAEQVESNLRMAYEYGHFQRTNLYSDIINWQEKNQPYTVMKP